MPLREYSAGMGASRLTWHDRTPLDVILSYILTGVVPHAAVQRWTYTVPAGRKAFVEYLTVKIVRATAAVAAGSVIGSVQFTIALGAYAGNYTLVYRQILTNNVGDKDEYNLGQGIIMLAGDTLSGHTGDTSNAGTIDYFVVAKITEFDA